MKPTLGAELRIFAFEGDRIEIKAQVDGWMERAGMVFEVVDIHYNYQGPEYDGRVPTTDGGAHGVLIVARQLTCNELRQQRGLPPLPAKEVSNAEEAEDDEPEGSCANCRRLFR
jgi:hypothetical protein